MEQRRLVVVLALVASFMVFVDGTIVNLTLAQLSSQLRATGAELEWAMNAYTLSFAAMMLGAGTLADVLGAKRTFVAGLLVFTAASAACALSGTMLELNLARSVQGIGAAMLLPSALILATRSAEGLSARSRLVGWWAAAGGLGMAAGPLLGGVLVAIAGWRSVFAVNVVIGIPAIVLTLRTSPIAGNRGRRLDFVGMAAATALIGSVVFALVEAPSLGWTSPGILIGLAVAIAAAIVFARVERKSPDALLPVSVYSDRSFTTSAGQGALFNFSFYGLLFALSLLLQQGRGLGPLQSGLLFLPLTGLIFLGNLCASAISRKLQWRTVLVLGHLTLAASLVAIAYASTLPGLWPLILALLPAGFAGGVLVPTMTSRSIATVPPSLHGASSAVFNTSCQVGSAVGIATFGPILQAVGNLEHGFVTGVLIAAAAVVIAVVLALTGVPSTRPCVEPDTAA